MIIDLVPYKYIDFPRYNGDEALHQQSSEVKPSYQMQEFVSIYSPRVINIANIYRHYLTQRLFITNFKMYITNLLLILYGAVWCIQQPESFTREFYQPTES